MATKTVNPSLGQGMLNFGAKMLSLLFENEVLNKKESPSSAITISPLSIGIALGMTLVGAAGKTRSELQNFFGISDTEAENFSNLMKPLFDVLQKEASDKVTFEIGNSMWLDSASGVQAKPSYSAELVKYFGAECRCVPFKGAMDIINQWCSEKTHGKIPKILGQDPEGVLMLINAIYFKGKWKMPFDPKRTMDVPFYTLSGKQHNVPLMTLSRTKFVYNESADWQYIELPYVGDAYRMVIVLPKKNDGLPQLVSDLRGDPKKFWEGVSAGSQMREGNIWIPKFKKEYQVTLNDVLKQLHCGHMFQSDAEFPKISESALRVASVIHKTFIEVNEEGTEAAAVTGVAFTLSLRTDTFTMKCDHPFLYTIKEASTGTLLFLGTITDPQ